MEFVGGEIRSVESDTGPLTEETHERTAKASVRVCNDKISLTELGMAGLLMEHVHVQVEVSPSSQSLCLAEEQEQGITPVVKSPW
jgi:hypothetical protein